MKIIGILTVSLFCCCNSDTIKSENNLVEKNIVAEDSVLLKFGQKTFTFNDERSPDLILFRELFIENLSDEPIYVTRLSDSQLPISGNSKFINGYSYEFYNLTRHNSWVNSFIEKRRDTTFYIIPASAIDTFWVIDYFLDNDSVFFHIDLFNPETHSYIEFERLFTRDGKMHNRNRKK